MYTLLYIVHLLHGFIIEKPDPNCSIVPKLIIGQQTILVLVYLSQFQFCLFTLNFIKFVLQL